MRVNASSWHHTWHIMVTQSSAVLGSQIASTTSTTAVLLSKVISFNHSNRIWHYDSQNTTWQRAYDKPKENLRSRTHNDICVVWIEVYPTGFFSWLQILQKVSICYIKFWWARSLIFHIMHWNGYASAHPIVAHMTAQVPALSCLRGDVASDANSSRGSLGFQSLVFTKILRVGSCLQCLSSAFIFIALMPFSLTGPVDVDYGKNADDADAGTVFSHVPVGRVMWICLSVLPFRWRAVLPRLQSFSAWQFQWHLGRDFSWAGPCGVHYFQLAFRPASCSTVCTCGIFVTILVGLRLRAFSSLLALAFFFILLFHGGTTP